MPPLIGSYELSQRQKFRVRSLSAESRLRNEVPLLEKILWVRVREAKPRCGRRLSPEAFAYQRRFNRFEHLSHRRVDANDTKAFVGLTEPPREDQGLRKAFIEHRDQNLRQRRSGVHALVLLWQVFQHALYAFRPLLDKSLCLPRRMKDHETLEAGGHAQAVHVSTFAVQLFKRHWKFSGDHCSVVHEHYHFASL
eukprot:scaffold845_cov231-Pinguiococcus_pyrenoidosus.AAC.12